MVSIRNILQYLRRMEASVRFLTSGTLTNLFDPKNLECWPSTLLSLYFHRGLVCCNRTYIDDWLIVRTLYQDAMRATTIMLDTLQNLGLKVNQTKSQLQPSQTITHIGDLFDSVQARAFIPLEQIIKLKKAIPLTLKLLFQPIMSNISSGSWHPWHQWYNTPSSN